MSQLELHKQIDAFFKTGVKSANAGLALSLISNEDAKRYFFSKADENWLSWLSQNKFFEVLKKKAGDLTRYSYRLPELEYLTRMAEKDPVMVASIIESTPVSISTFNPEVVDRFLWIIGLLPAAQTKPLLEKALKEEWIKLMSAFNRSGYEYVKMVEKLSEAKDFDALITLAKMLLTLRSKEELQSIGNFSVTDKLFYLHDITETGIFPQLTSPDNKKKEETLSVILDVLGSVVTYGKDREETVFANTEPFHLLDINLFTVDINTTRKSYRRDDIENLIALARILIRDIMDTLCNDATQVGEFYDKYIEPLPDSRTVYRLKLYAATRCPAIFKDKLKELLFRVFAVGERYFEIEGGAEYHSALIDGFKALDQADQRSYVANVFEYFAASLGDKDKEVWRRRDGLKIMVFIKSFLTQDEVKKAEDLLGKFPVGGQLAPQPDIMPGEAGFVSHRSPVNIADYSIEQIIRNLKSDWSPSTLKEQFKGDDYLSPRGTEGLGDSLKEDIKKRFDEYLANINDFFDRDNIAPHYICSLIRGIEEMLRNKKTITFEQAEKVIGLFVKIKDSGVETPFEGGDEKVWLADWIEVHKVAIDVLLFLIENKQIKQQLHSTPQRGIIRDLISYFLTISSSPTKEQEKSEYGEPYHIAINSVRGRAYEAFVVFTESEGDALTDDVKKIFIQSLKDDSIAVRFVVGRYLASFYFRDKEFIKSLLPEIFPKDVPAKKDAYLATWEGYLSNTLYDKLFVELSDYYAHAITLDPKIYTDRKYFRGLDESLAIHVALAFAHLGLNTTDDLFVKFWSTPNTVRQHEFVSFIGRSILTRDQAGDDWMTETKVKKEKLIGFWDWILNNDDIKDPKVFTGFGFWINPDKEIISYSILIPRVAWTLKRSEGEIDWDYGLTRRLKSFAETDPSNTLEIIKSYLLRDGELSPHRRSPLFSLEHEIKEALEIIYKGSSQKVKVRELISTLIEKGSSAFWGLKDVLVDDN